MKWKMIVGLGNPGPRYARNRHNIGFQVIDILARRHNIALNRVQHKALVGTGVIRGRRNAPRPEGAALVTSEQETLPAGSWGNLPQEQRVILVKPLTYMNNSGQAVAALARYYQVDPQDILVIHDDLDLPPGRIRIRPKGGSGGQRGVQSIIDHLGTQEFPRIRVGIGRPPEYMDPADYVLQDFSEEEEALFGSVREQVADAVECWLFEGIDAAMNRYNR